MAVERASWVPRSQEVVHIRDSEDIEVEVDSDDLAWALFGILIGLIEKTPEGSRVDIDLRPCGNSWTIRLFVPGGNDKHRQPHEYHLSRVPFVLAEYGMQLKRSTTLEGLRYIVTNERDANKSMQATPNGAPDG
jgi:hypothetical protein